MRYAVCGLMCAVCGVRCDVCGVWCAVCCVWFDVCGLWCAVCCVRCDVCGVRFDVCGLWWAVRCVRCVVCDMCVLCDVCGVRYAVHTYWLVYRYQGCGPHTMFSVAVILGEMRRNKVFGSHVLFHLFVNKPNAFDSRNDPTDSLEQQIMAMKDYASKYPTSSAQYFSSDSCF